MIRIRPIKISDVRSREMYARSEDIFVYSGQSACVNCGLVDRKIYGMEEDDYCSKCMEMYLVRCEYCKSHKKLQKVHTDGMMLRVCPEHIDQAIEEVKKWILKNQIPQ